MPVTFLIARSGATFNAQTRGAAMKKVLSVIAIAFALVAGTTAVMTIHPQPAYAECSGGSC
jgi:hypothetical protein